ncbi:hypothetical protein RRG08_027160 [Elysia crispata]|uniref:Uncharacterized protein n=1 Tax=Elysia crispata TaxID=231223 RepID=A0AAE1B5B7_9GAST|nr:hypothetical protein RRG08_027160 [Elysia crispata]
MLLKEPGEEEKQQVVQEMGSHEDGDQALKCDLMTSATGKHLKQKRERTTRANGDSGLDCAVMCVGIYQPCPSRRAISTKQRWLDQVGSPTGVDLSLGSCLIPTVQRLLLGCATRIGHGLDVTVRVDADSYKCWA